MLHPRFPQRICWGCDRLCPADDLACGNGTIRTPHPQELFGDDWLVWSEGLDRGGDRSAPPGPILPADAGIERDDVSKQERIEHEEHS